MATRLVRSNSSNGLVTECDQLFKIPGLHWFHTPAFAVPPLHVTSWAQMTRFSIRIAAMSAFEKTLKNISRAKIAYECIMRG